MDSTKLIQFITIAIIVVIINVENANAEETTSSQAFEIFYNHLSSMCILTEYREDIYNRVMSSLNESTLPTPLEWCTKNITFDYGMQLCEGKKDGRYALRKIYFYWKFVQDYNTYIFKTVMRLIESGNIVVQSPSQYCSANRAPNIAREKLTQLSRLGLSMNSSTEIEVNNTSEHLATSSQTGESSFKDFDLNLTTDEYNEKVEKNKRMKIKY